MCLSSLRRSRRYVCGHPILSAGEDISERDWPKSLSIDADVELPGHALEPSVGVAVQVYGPLSHLVPGAESIMAEDQVMAAFPELDVVLNAGPSIRGGRRLGIVVSHDQMLAAVEQSQQLRAVAGLRRHEVAKMPYVVVLPYDRVPVADEHRVVLRHVGEWSPIDAEHPRIAEVRIAREEDHIC